MVAELRQRADRRGEHDQPGEAEGSEPQPRPVDLGQHAVAGRGCFSEYAGRGGAAASTSAAAATGRGRGWCGVRRDRRNARSPAASSAVTASRVIRSSSTPVPICTLDRPTIRCSSEASRSTLRTRSSGAVLVFLFSSPLRIWNWVSVVR